MKNIFSGQLKKIFGALASSLKNRAGFYLLFWLIVCLSGIGLVFYFYIFNPTVETPSNILIKIDKNLYQEVSAKLNAREINIQQGIEASYPDPFK